MRAPHIHQTAHMICCSLCLFFLFTLEAVYAFVYMSLTVTEANSVNLVNLAACVNMPPYIICTILNEATYNTQTAQKDVYICLINKKVKAFLFALNGHTWRQG